MASMAPRLADLACIRGTVAIFRTRNADISRDLPHIEVTQRRSTRAQIPLFGLNPSPHTTDQNPSSPIIRRRVHRYASICWIFPSLTLNTSAIWK